MRTFSEKVLEYYADLERPPISDPDVRVLFPFELSEGRENLQRFYTKFYSDTNERTFIVGINPGRIGSGTTGIPFTDGYTLRKFEISNSDPLSKELTAQFVQQLIEECGGAEFFYKKFFLTSVCPVGFTKHGINFNFYDDPELLKNIEPYIVDTFTRQITFGARDTAIVWGKGKNFKYFKKLNERHAFFKEIIPLEHPRYLMQYKRSSLPEQLERQKRVIESLH